jgi:cysteine desulfurase
MKRIYLDHNATTPVDPAVKSAMAAALDEFGNPSSSHWFGQRAAARVEEAREEVAALLGASTGEIYFTSGATEANNTALRGVAYALAAKGRRIVTSTIEHPSVLQVCQDLEKRGFEVAYVPAGPSGRVQPEAVAAAVNGDTILISIMTANNETGVVQPVAEIGRIARERGVLFHTDAVQAVGKLGVDLREQPVDLLSLSGHKFYGPKGVGVLYVRSGVRLQARMLGGGQERGIRAGTENVPGIAGLGAAALLVTARGQDWPARIAAMRDRFESLILDSIADVVVNGDREHRLPNTSNMSFKDAEGEAVSITLDLKGVAVSTGSACSSGAAHPSSVLGSMGLPPRQVDCALRFSLGKDNTMEEVEQAAALVKEAVEKIRSISRG